MYIKQLIIKEVLLLNIEYIIYKIKITTIII